MAMAACTAAGSLGPRARRGDERNASASRSACSSEVPSRGEGVPAGVTTADAGVLTLLAADCGVLLLDGGETARGRSCARRLGLLEGLHTGLLAPPAVPGG